jgi:hypothetical protein
VKKSLTLRFGNTNNLEILPLRRRGKTSIQRKIDFHEIKFKLKTSPSPSERACTAMLLISAERGEAKKCVPTIM